MLTITYQHGPFQVVAEVETPEQAQRAAQVFHAFKREAETPPAIMSLTPDVIRKSEVEGAEARLAQGPTRLEVANRLEKIAEELRDAV